MKQRIQRLITSVGARQGLVMAAATLAAGGFDYVVNIIIGRMLSPAEFIIFVAVTALLQVFVHVTNVIRNVVAFYTAEFTTQSDAQIKIGAFVRQGWRWAWKWGLVGTAVMALSTPLLANLLRVTSVAPLLAGAFLLLLLFLRPVTDGALQGLQHFWGLGTVQVAQAFLRLLLAPLLIWLGWQSFGAILSLPLASSGALVLAVWFLWPYFQTGQGGTAETAVSIRYSTYTLLGLLAFALLINLDAIMVKRVFAPEIAGNYAPVVTLGKINMFIPLGIGLVLFPKTTQRQAAGRDPRPVLLLALAATLTPGFLLTALYFSFPQFLVQTIFTDVYADPGLVLGLAGLATTLYAGINIWLNYALSLERRGYVWALVGVVVLQMAGMGVWHGSLVEITAVMVAAGLLGNIAGVITTFPVSK